MSQRRRTPYKAPRDRRELVMAVLCAGTALADEGSRGDATQSGGIPGFLCCWTNAQLMIVVKASDQGAGKGGGR